MALFDGCENAVPLLFTVNVVSHRLGLASSIPDGGCHALGALSVEVGKIDESAFLGKAACGRGAEATMRSGAGYQRDLSVEAAHRYSLLVSNCRAARGGRLRSPRLSWQIGRAHV